MLRCKGTLEATVVVEEVVEHIRQPRFDGRPINANAALLSVFLLGVVLAGLFACGFVLVIGLFAPETAPSVSALIGGVVGFITTFLFLLLLGSRPEGGAMMRVIYWLTQVIKRPFGRANLDRQTRLLERRVRIEGVLELDVDASPPSLTWVPRPDSQTLVSERELEGLRPPLSDLRGLDAPTRIRLRDGEVTADFTRAPSKAGRVSVRLRDLEGGGDLTLSIPDDAETRAGSKIALLEREGIDVDDPLFIDSLIETLDALSTDLPTVFSKARIGVSA